MLDHFAGDHYCQRHLKKGQTMTQNNNNSLNIPQHYVDELANVLNRIEAAIRADERDRIISKMRGNLFAEQTSQPLQESDQQPRGIDLNRTHYELIRWLSSGTFMAVPTLAGHLGVQKQSVYAYLDGLKRAGYNLEIRNTGNLKGGYRNIYRLAQSA
jgi:hypothetical protein